MAMDELSKVFSALADPTRRKILLRLGEGEATVTQLAQPLPMSLPAVSRHLKVLEQAGLIARDRRAQWRTSSLRTESLREATDWMEHLRALWGHRFDRLDAHLAALKQLKDPGDHHDDRNDGTNDPERNDQQ
jgi:DNA-binding transcriptional ArsR family regulator